MTGRGQGPVRRGQLSVQKAGDAEPQPELQLVDGGTPPECFICLEVRLEGNASAALLRGCDGVRVEWRVSDCHGSFRHVGLSAPRGPKRADLLIWFVVTWPSMTNGPWVTFNRHVRLNWQ